MASSANRTENQPRASVIVPAHNAAPGIGRCLVALQAQQGVESLEIIVVDDGSSDDTAAVAAAHGAMLIRQQQQGPAAARNAGAQAAHGSLLLFTDADCEPTPDWAYHLLAAFADPRVVGAKGSYLSRQREIVARFTQMEYEERYRHMRRYDTIDFIDTYSAAYRREIFLAAGGFDTVFSTPSVEDQEFSFRLARQGHKLVFVPEATVYHRHNYTVKQYWRRKFSIGYWKALVMRRYPERLAQDSHTPGAVRWQMILLPFIIVAMLLSSRRPKVRRLAGAEAFVFYATDAGFLRRLWQKDKPVAGAAFFLLPLRAAALLSGFFLGTVFVLRQIH